MRDILTINWYMLETPKCLTSNEAIAEFSNVITGQLGHSITSPIGKALAIMSMLGRVLVRKLQGHPKLFPNLGQIIIYRLKATNEIDTDLAILIVEIFRLLFEAFFFEHANIVIQASTCRDIIEI